MQATTGKGTGRWTVAVATALLAGAAGSADLEAQTRALGLVAGPVDARQLRTHDDDSDGHSGFLAGAWIDVQTPASPLSVTAEAVVARRGGVYPRPDGFDRQIDVDYLAVSVLPTLRVGRGPLAVVVYAGPSLDVHLQSRSALELQGPFRQANGQVFAGVVGGGVEFRRGRATFRLEGRLHQQLSSAFAGDIGSVEHRSTEFVFRLGRRPRP